MEATSLGQLTSKPAKVMGQATENALSRYPASTEADEIPEDIPVPASETSKKGQAAPPDDEAAIRDFEVLIKGASPAPAKAAPAKATSAKTTAPKPN
jgi:hypothetical protein